MTTTAATPQQLEYMRNIEVSIPEECSKELASSILDAWQLYKSTRYRGFAVSRGYVRFLAHDPETPAISSALSSVGMTDPTHGQVLLTADSDEAAHAAIDALLD